MTCSSDQNELDGFTHNAQAYGTTEAEAIAAWNTRSCVQCEGGAVPMTDEAMAKHGWVRERTCHDTWDTELTGRLRFQCSICGAVSLEITPMYCPNCGAEVVDA